MSESTHINFGGLGKSPDRVNVVIENDDAHHHPHAEQHGVRVSEPTAVLPATKSEEEKREIVRQCLEDRVSSQSWRTLLLLFGALHHRFW